MSESVSIAENRRDVHKIEGSQVFLYDRPQKWILSHRTN